MAKKVERKIREKKERAKKSVFPLTRENYYLFGIGILVIILGNISLMQGPADSFWSLTFAPILLVLGYCVIIPVSILYKKKLSQEKSGD
ncbi:hypothetical protein JXB12_03470 [candidate division KSB1 bacterium]|nr:hypothetical protein [candidate division KSB1 bacterium]